MNIEEYEPRSTLVVPHSKVSRARYPFIDVHSHQYALMSPERLDELVAEMDAMNMRILVNLSGRWGERLKAGVRNMKGRYGKRFAMFANLNFEGIGSYGWSARAASQLAEDVRNGAQGLKVNKNLGLELRDPAGRRIPVNDPQLDPVFETCAALGIPVLIHSGEPRQFFEPHDRHNERWLELNEEPLRARPPERYPSWERVMGEQHDLFARHAATTFINAHLGWMGGDLAALGSLLERLPNVYTEIGAVLAEIGRQPRFARRWFIQYQDRVMFGKDTWNSPEYRVYFRVLETDDEYFDYYRKRHAHWKLYGLDLPDEVLKKLYFANALRVIPGLCTEGFEANI